MLKGVYFIIFSQRGQRNYVWPWFIFIYVGSWTNNRLWRSSGKQRNRCLSLIDFVFVPNQRRFRMSRETVFFFKNSILGVLLSVLENFCRRFSDPTDCWWVSEDAFGGKERTKGQSLRKRQTERGIGSGKGRLPFPLHSSLVNWSLYLLGNTHDVTLLKLFYMHGLKPKN